MGGVHARAYARSILLEELRRQEETHLISIRVTLATRLASFLQRPRGFTFGVSQVTKYFPAVLAKQWWRQAVDDGALAETDRVGDTGRALEPA